MSAPVFTLLHEADGVFIRRENVAIEDLGSMLNRLFHAGRCVGVSSGRGGSVSFTVRTEINGTPFEMTTKRATPPGLAVFASEVVERVWGSK